MMTWTCEFKGYWLNGYAVVTSESVEMAVILLERELADRGLPQKITHDMLIPMVTSTRKVRILFDGDSY